jgi:hypothetical protein
VIQPLIAAPLHSHGREGGLYYGDDLFTVPSDSEVRWRLADWRFTRDLFSIQVKSSP